MVKTNKEITTLNHVKLSILLLQNGLSFCAKNLLNNEIENEGLIFTGEELTFHPTYNSFDIIHFAYVNYLNTFVPKSFFDVNQLETYLKFNVKLLKYDSICYDEISTFDLVNVYVATSTPEYFSSKIEIEKKSHFATTLVTKLLEQNKNNPVLQFFVHFIDDSFQIVIIENSKLKFYNSFTFSSEIDVLYYILFVAEQLSLNPEDFSLILLGDIHKETETFKIIYQYVRNVSFYTTRNDVSYENFVLHQL